MTIPELEAPTAAEYPDIDQAARRYLCELLDRIHATRRLIADVGYGSLTIDDRAEFAMRLATLYLVTSHHLPEIRAETDRKLWLGPWPLSSLSDDLDTIHREIVDRGNGDGLRSLRRRVNRVANSWGGGDA